MCVHVSCLSSMPWRSVYVLPGVVVVEFTVAVRGAPGVHSGSTRRPRRAHSGSTRRRG